MAADITKNTKTILARRSPLRLVTPAVTMEQASELAPAFSGPAVLAWGLCFRSPSSSGVSHYFAAPERVGATAADQISDGADVDEGRLSPIFPSAVQEVSGRFRKKKLNPKTEEQLVTMATTKLLIQPAFAVSQFNTKRAPEQRVASSPVRALTRLQTIAAAPSRGWVGENT